MRVFVKAGRPFRILGVDGQDDGVTAEARPDAAADARADDQNATRSKPGQSKRR